MAPGYLAVVQSNFAGRALPDEQARRLLLVDGERTSSIGPFDDEQREVAFQRLGRRRASQRGEVIEIRSLALGHSAKCTKHADQKLPAR